MPAGSACTYIDRGFVSVGSNLGHFLREKRGAYEGASAGAERDEICHGHAVADVEQRALAWAQSWGWIQKNKTSSETTKFSKSERWDPFWFSWHLHYYTILCIVSVHPKFP